MHSASSSPTSWVLTFTLPRPGVPNSHPSERTKYQILRLPAKYSFSLYVFRHENGWWTRPWSFLSHTATPMTLCPLNHTSAHLTRWSQLLWTENAVGDLCLLPPGPSLSSLRGGALLITNSYRPQCAGQGPLTLRSSPVVLLC